MWSPSNFILFNGSELSALNVNASYTPQANETVISHTFLGFNEPIEPITVTESTNAVNFRAASLEGTFKPNFIQYKDGENIIQVNGWEDLPEGKELTHFSPNTLVSKIYLAYVQVTLDVTEEGSGTTTQEVLSQVFQITIYANWTAGRNLLKGYMNASS